MTILGRMTEKGYPQAALSAFSDAAAVPSWAKEHVATLVGMEVVGGSNGKLRPSSPVTPGRGGQNALHPLVTPHFSWEKSLANDRIVWYHAL